MQTLIYLFLKRKKKLEIQVKKFYIFPLLLRSFKELSNTPFKKKKKKELSNTRDKTTLNI